MSVTSAPGKGGCRRNYGWLGSPLKREPTSSSGNTTGASSTTSSPWRRGSQERRFGARPDPTWYWIFTLQTERVVAKDNTVAIADRSWQLEKSKFRGSLAGCTVTIHEHLNGNVSIRYGPHIVGRYQASGETLAAGTKKPPESRGKDGSVETVENHKPVSHGPHRPLEIPQPRRDFHFSTAPTIASSSYTNTRTRSRKPPSASRRGHADLTIKRSIKRAKRTDHV